MKKMIAGCLIIFSSFAIAQFPHLQDGDRTAAVDRATYNHYISCDNHIHARIAHFHGVTDFCALKGSACKAFDDSLSFPNSPWDNDSKIILCEKKRDGTCPEAEDCGFEHWVAHPDARIFEHKSKQNVRESTSPKTSQ